MNVHRVGPSNNTTHTSIANMREISRRLRSYHRLHDVDQAASNTGHIKNTDDGALLENLTSHNLHFLLYALNILDILILYYNYILR